MLLIRLRSLGDCVLTTPAIRLLKSWRPDVEIGVAVEDRFRAVYEGNPDISEILAPTSAAVRAFRPELTLNLHGGTQSLFLTLASMAPRRAGFAHYRGRCVYNVRIPRAQEVLQVDRKVHTAEHVASAMFFLGVPRQPIPRARLFAEKTNAAKPYAVIHPFATAAEKQWPPAKFAEIARQLDAEPVFIGTSADNFTPFAGFRASAGPLAETKRLLAGASLFIGNDSGPAHMAAAFGLPSVVLFGPSDEVVWAPWQTESRVLKRIPLSDLPVEDVRTAVAQLGVRA